MVLPNHQDRGRLVTSMEVAAARRVIIPTIVAKAVAALTAAKTTISTLKVRIKKFHNRNRPRRRTLYLNHNNSPLVVV